MKNRLKNIPTPLAGLGLGLAGFASLTMNFNAKVGYVISFVALVTLLMVLLKILLNFRIFPDELKHPVLGSIIPTFTMGIMILSNFVSKFHFTFGKVLWITAVIIHAVLLIVFLLNFIKNFNFLNIIPSYFIPPVGIVVACVSGKIFNMPELCNVIFYLGFVSYLILLPVVLIRLKKGELPKPKKPTMAILAAPASLCLAAYFTMGNLEQNALLYILVPLSVIMTLFVYYKLINLIRKPFNPGFSAFTFPLVISAVAMFKYAGYLSKSGIEFAQYVKIFGFVQYWIAAAVIAYVSIKYFQLIFLRSKKIA